MPAVQSQQPGGGSSGRGAGKGGNAAGGGGGVAEVLESTLWSRQLGELSEQLVAALVCQIFEGAPAGPCEGAEGTAGSLCEGKKARREPLGCAGCLQASWDGPSSTR